MKNTILILVTATALVLTGCFEKGPANPTGSLLRSHFVGMNQVNQLTNHLKLSEVWSLESSRDLRKQALDKIAATPFKLWRESLPAGVADQPVLIRPLLDDLILSESFIELKGPKSDFDSVLAVQLEPDRMRLWRTNLWQLAAAWKLATPKGTPGTENSWEARAHGVTFQLQTRGQWLLAGWSLGKPSAFAMLGATLERSGRPVPSLTNTLLDLHADLPSLSRWSPLIAKHKLPPVDLTVSPRGEYIRTEARFSLPEALAWKFEPWQIPTNLISEPLASFTVAQGIGPVLNALPGFTELGLKNTPSQMCGWSQQNASFKAYWAFPVKDSTNVLRQITAKAQPFLKHYFEKPPGNIVYSSNESQFAWYNLPFILPTVRTVSEQGTEFIQMGLLPFSTRNSPPPPELFAQIGDRKDLLCYDWEVTQQRLRNSKYLYQVSDILHLRYMAGTNDPSLKWFDEAAPHLGNCVTELTAPNPKELQLVRKSHVGFTGFELATMLRWVDSPAFPLDYEPRPTVNAKKPDKSKPTKGH